MSINKIKSFDREIAGHINQLEKGKTAPGLIVARARTMIMPLKANNPVRIHLKRFTDRDAYYPIAIFPVSKNKGVNK